MTKFKVGDLEDVAFLNQFSSNEERLRIGRTAKEAALKIGIGNNAIIDNEKSVRIKESRGIVYISDRGSVFHVGCYGIRRSKTKSGRYLQVVLKKGSTASVHRLVARYFIDNPENLPCVNHIDGNKHNNVKENLEWCSYSENQQHSYRTLRRKIPHTLS